MTAHLSIAEVEHLTAQVHAAQRDIQQAVDERANDAAVDAALLEVAKAKQALDRATIMEAALSAKYGERVIEAQEREKALRQRLIEGWPDQGAKSIGCASLTTRRTVTVRENVGPVQAFRALDTLLGATGILPSAITRIEVDSKLLLPLVDSMPALRDVLSVRESRSVTIRKPKED